MQDTSPQLSNVHNDDKFTATTQDTTPKLRNVHCNDDKPTGTTQDTTPQLRARTVNFNDNQPTGTVQDTSPRPYNVYSPDVKLSGTKENRSSLPHLFSDDNICAHSRHSFGDVQNTAVPTLVTASQHISQSEVATRSVEPTAQLSTTLVSPSTDILPLSSADSNTIHYETEPNSPFIDTHLQSLTAATTPDNARIRSVMLVNTAAGDNDLHLLFATVIINRHIFLALIDGGASRSIVNDTAVSRFNLTERALTTPVHMTYANNTAFQATTCITTTVIIPSFIESKVTLTVAPLSPDLDLILGRDFLGRHRIAVHHTI